MCSSDAYCLCGSDDFSYQLQEALCRSDAKCLCSSDAFSYHFSSSHKPPKPSVKQAVSQASRKPSKPRRRSLKDSQRELTSPASQPASQPPLHRLAIAGAIVQQDGRLLRNLPNDQWMTSGSPNHVTPPGFPYRRAGLELNI